MMHISKFKGLPAVATLMLLFAVNTGWATLPVTTNLQLWLDASDTGSIVAGDGTLNNGDKISAWNDILVGGNTTAENALQADGDKQPIWLESVAEVNNNSVIMFDGGKDYLNLSSLYLGPEITVFIVSQNAIQTHFTSTYHRPILAADNNPWSGGGGFYDGDGYGFAYSRSGVDSFLVALADADSGYLDDVATSLLQDFSFNVLTFRRNGDATDGSELFVRGLGDAADVLVDADRFFEETSLHTGYDIGANPPEHDGHEYRFYTGQIAEIIIYSSDLSETDTALVSDYLYDKYVDPTVCGRSGIVYNQADLNEDCVVDLYDFALLAGDFMDVCTDLGNPACDQYWKPAELAKQQWENWRASWTDSFPIASWAYFSRYGGTAAEYQTYADANLTMVMAPLEDYYAARNAGLRPFIGSWKDLFADQIELDYYMDFVADDDAMFAGYMFDDEPKTQVLFDQIAEATQYVYNTETRACLPVVNLLPEFGTLAPDFPDYESYIDGYIDTVHPAVLSYDHYAVLEDGSDRANFYNNMELIRDRALANEIGFMGFALVTSIDGVYRQPSESDLNWQVYSLITYGAKGIWYWNYRIDDSSTYGDGLVTHATGAPSATYPIAQAINAELIAMGPMLMDLETTAVYHTGSSVPSGTTQYTNGDVSVLSDFTGDDFLIGEFFNGEDQGDTADYLMIMNKRHSGTTISTQEQAAASFTVQPTSLDVYQFNTTTEQWDLLSGSGGAYSVTIGGGKGILLRLVN